MKKKGTNVNNGRKVSRFTGMSFRFPDADQLQLIDRAARASGLSSSAFVRLVSLAVAKRVLRVSGDRTLGDALIDTPSTVQERKTA